MMPRLSALVVSWSVVSLGSPCLAGAASAPQKGKVTVDKVEYKGWKNNLRISNGEAELIVTLDVGPRIISYRLANGKNVFKEFPDQLGKSGEATWQIRGGHRLWAAPEDTTRTYAPDNRPVAVKELSGGVWRVTGPVDEPYGIQREMDIALEPTGTAVKITHRIHNVGSKPAELAPWSLSVMAPGGVEVIPLPSKAPHPGSSKEPVAAENFLPNQSLVMWSYTDMKDPRFEFGTKYILVRHDSKRSATKIGLAHAPGWVAHSNDGTLFVKHFPYQKGKHYPDRGCNFETYTDEGILEIESLGPMVELAPGKATEHTETWMLRSFEHAIKNEQDAERVGQVINRP